MTRLKAFGLGFTALSAACVLANPAFARDQIRIAGSSTVYPFSSYVAEEFGAVTDFSSPVVESTGTGGGFKLFCEGVGEQTTDISNASRQMKKSEFETCQQNGVESITEAKIGFDGIVIGQAVDMEPLALTREQLAMAVLKQVPKNGELVPNAYKRWNEIDSSLPDREIVVYGPPTTSGTRDAFEELVLEEVTQEMDAYDGEKYSEIRTDGVYIPSGENDNLIVQTLERNKDAVGIFGFSFLEENKDRIQASTVDGVEPTRDNISSGDYPVSRSLFFYTKNAHFGVIPGMEEFVELFMSEKMIGDRGALKKIGLIPLPKDERETRRDAVMERKQLSASDL